MIQGAGTIKLEIGFLDYPEPPTLNKKIFRLYELEKLFFVQHTISSQVNIPGI